MLHAVMMHKKVLRTDVFTVHMGGMLGGGDAPVSCPERNRWFMSFALFPFSSSYSGPFLFLGHVEPSSVFKRL